MTRQNDTSPAADGGSQARAWIAPRMRRLATSAASNNPTGGGADAEGFS